MIRGDKCRHLLPTLETGFSAHSQVKTLAGAASLDFLSRIALLWEGKYLPLELWSLSKPPLTDCSQESNLTWQLDDSKTIVLLMVARQSGI